MLRKVRVIEGMDVWDGFNITLLAPSSPEFWMPDME